MWKVGDTVITSQMADEVHQRANEEWSIPSIAAMLIRDYGVKQDDAEKVVEEVLSLNE